MCSGNGRTGDLVRLFAERFEEQKRAQNMIDFSDMEQYALRILTQKTENGFVPSKIAEEYQKQFEEIMIDEYQDSNLIRKQFLPVYLAAEAEDTIYLWWGCKTEYLQIPSVQTGIISGKIPHI